MPATKYYPIAVSSTRGTNEPSAKQSTALPNGTNGPSSYTTGPQYFEMRSTGVSPAATVRPNWTTLAQTGRQSTFLQHGWFRLGTQTIAAGTWRIAGAVLESDLNSNAFFALSIYVWRPSTSSVVGYIYDAATELGAEWPLTTAASRLASVSGNSVSALNGDTLIVEFWATNAQAAATSYTNRVFFDASSANADFSADGQADLNSWIEAPDTLIAYDANLPIGDPPNRIVVNRVGTENTFTVSQNSNLGVFVKSI